MEFSKSIQSMKKHYFYSYQKPTKLVYEIFSSLLVNRALVYLRYFFTVYHDACIENLLLCLILFTFRIKLKAPPPPSND